MSAVKSPPRYCFPALVADTLVVVRLGVMLTILWLGWTQGRAALHQVVLLATVGWISDGLDGPVSRRSPCPTKLGALDYPLDVALTWAELTYAVMAGFILPGVAMIYTGLTALATLWFRRKVVLALFMRGIDILLIVILLQVAPLYLLPLLLWLLILAYIERDRMRRDIPQRIEELVHLIRPRPTKAEREEMD